MVSISYNFRFQQDQRVYDKTGFRSNYIHHFYPNCSQPDSVKLESLEAT